VDHDAPHLDVHRAVAVERPEEVHRCVVVDDLVELSERLLLLLRVGRVASDVEQAIDLRVRVAREVAAPARVELLAHVLVAVEGPLAEDQIVVPLAPDLGLPRRVVQELHVDGDALRLELALEVDDDLLRGLERLVRREMQLERLSVLRPVIAAPPVAGAFEQLCRAGGSCAYGATSWL
jgi:hypothetical protein